MEDGTSVKLSQGDIQVLLESLNYSQLHVREAQGTPYAVRRENLSRLDAVAAKLRAMRTAMSQ